MQEAGVRGSVAAGGLRVVVMGQGYFAADPIDACNSVFHKIS